MRDSCRRVLARPWVPTVPPAAPGEAARGHCRRAPCQKEEGEEEAGARTRPCSRRAGKNQVQSISQTQDRETHCFFFPCLEGKSSAGKEKTPQVKFGGGDEKEEGGGGAEGKGGKDDNNRPIGPDPPNPHGGSRTSLVIVP